MTESEKVVEVAQFLECYGVLNDLLRKGITPSRLEEEAGRAADTYVREAEQVYKDNSPPMLVPNSATALSSYSSSGSHPTICWCSLPRSHNQTPWTLSTDACRNSRRNIGCGPPKKCVPKHQNRHRALRGV
jgi:hypothetical protein